MCLLDVSTFVQSDRERGGRKGPDFGGVLMMRVVEEIADEWAKREKRENFRVWGKVLRAGDTKGAKTYQDFAD